jgi:hypothetical protein
MTESSRPSEAGRRAPKQDKGADEKIGRALGRAFGRLKQTRVWKDTSQAYKDGLQGKDDR